MSDRYIYNVLVAGQSIGMTFRKWEAESWKKSSMHENVVIAKVPYDEPVTTLDLRFRDD